MIVIFNDNAPFEAFRPNYRADDRAAANPDAWSYLDRGVAVAKHDHITCAPRRAIRPER